MSTLSSDSYIIASLASNLFNEGIALDEITNIVSNKKFSNTEKKEKLLELKTMLALVKQLKKIKVSHVSIYNTIHAKDTSIREKIEILKEMGVLKNEANILLKLGANRYSIYKIIRDNKLDFKKKVKKLNELKLEMTLRAKR